MHPSSLQSQAPAPELAADAQLAARAAAGEDSAFETIMRRHNRLLFRTARSILHSDAEAEDALQEAYLRAWRALDSFRADARLSTWLVRIVINESLGRLRRGQAQVIPWMPPWNRPNCRTRSGCTTQSISSRIARPCAPRSAA